MYGKLYNQCHPRQNAITNNRKFLRGNPPEPQLQPELEPTDKTADPRLWGPHLWAYLHYSAMNYPNNPSQKQKEAMKDWLCCLSATIPCKNCSNHYSKYIEQHRSRLDEICSSKDKLFNFLVDIHNKVNKRNGKREVSYTEARQIYKRK